jgi:hypothetical protein
VWRGVYGIVESMASIVVREFCVAIKKHLKPLVTPKLTINKIKEITTSFEHLHGISYILCAINHKLSISQLSNGNHAKFKMLKGRFRILFKRVDIPFCHMPDLMTICIWCALSIWMALIWTGVKPWNLAP